MWSGAHQRHLCIIKIILSHVPFLSVHIKVWSLGLRHVWRFYFFCHCLRTLTVGIHSRVIKLIVLVKAISKPLGVFNFYFWNIWILIWHLRISINHKLLRRLVWVLVRNGLSLGWNFAYRIQYVSYGSRYKNFRYIERNFGRSSNVLFNEVCVFQISVKDHSKNEKGIE